MGTCIEKILKYRNSQGQGQGATAAFRWRVNASVVPSRWCAAPSCIKLLY